MSFRKCGTCIHFYVKPNEIEIAQHAPDISACQPGMPHCLGGQVRGGCGRWEERAQMGLPMPWGDGPMVENTFGCKLWQRGGPSVKQIGSFNVSGAEKAPVLGGFASPLAVIAGIIAAGAVKNFMSKKEDDYGYEEDVIFEQDDDFYYE
jgi:hypothetical protein